MKLKHSHIPLVYFPANVILLDDDTDFLDSLKNRFEKKQLTGKFNIFDDAVEAEKYIQKQNESLSELCLSFKETYPGSRKFDILNQFSNFHKQSHLDCTSLAVVDYAMPAKNGLEFAKELRNISPETKILMLTGEADEKLAIEAFNNGLIDSFIKKENPGVAAELIKSAQKLITQYFLDQTNTILGNIDPNEECGLPSFLNHKKACEFIQSKFPLEECQSFCLMDEQGSFKVEKKDNSTQYFKLLNHNEHKSLLDELEENLDKNDTILKNAIEKKSVPISDINGNEVEAPINQIKIEDTEYLFTLYHQP